MITPAYSSTATERVLPSMTLDFLTGVLDPRVTIARALDTATRVNSSGVIEVVAANLPRFDYDPTTLACNGLLIEAARTNLLTYSSDFTNIAWTKSYSAMAGTFTTAPDGTNTGAKWNELSTPIAEHQIYKTSSLTAALYTETWYLKAAERTRVRVSLATAGLVLGASVIADLSAGTLSAVTNLGGHTGGTATISSAGNSWYRVSLTITATVAVYYPALTMVTGTSTVYYIGDDTSGIFIWGAQLEAGAFPTSYIPTTTTSLTRNVDQVAMTGTNFSDWYNQSEGAFAAEYIPPTIATTLGVLSVNDGTTNNRIDARSNGISFVTSGGATQAGMVATGAVANAINRCVVGYKLNSFAFAVNGNAPATDTSGSIPTVSRLVIGAVDNFSPSLNGHMRKLRYWPLRITNAEVQAFSK
jgi:hypothetical protein